MGSVKLLRIYYDEEESYKYKTKTFPVMLVVVNVFFLYFFNFFWLTLWMRCYNKIFKHMMNCIDVNTVIYSVLFRCNALLFKWFYHGPSTYVKFVKSIVFTFYASGDKKKWFFFQDHLKCLKVKNIRKPFSIIPNLTSLLYWIKSALLIFTLMLVMK